MSFKLRMRTLFPALVNVTSPITLTKAGATYTFGFNMDQAPTGPQGPAGPTGAAGAGYGGTSATSLLIANSVTKTFTMNQTGLAYQPGNYVRAASTSAPSNFMEGTVSGYSGTTLSINVTTIGGSGTFSDWAIGLSGLPGSVGVSTLNGLNGALALLIQPQGRLTLTSATPVMTTSVAAATTVYYALYAGNQCPIYDGANMVPTAFTELSQATTDATKSPAAVTTNSNYDVFVWNDSGTLRATRGPAWTSDTARGTGAGTTELQLVNGIYLNKNAITNGPAANRGTYVGTIRSNGTSTIDYIFGAAGAGGVAAVFGVWNCFNRVNVATTVMDNTNSWTYAVASTWRAANSNTTMRVSAVRGLDEDGIEATYYAIARTTAGGTGIAGVGVNSTTAYSGTTQGTINTTDFLAMPARFSGTIGLGYRFVSAIEYNDTTNTTTWRGLLTSLPFQSGFHATLRQ